MHTIPRMTWTTSAIPLFTRDFVRFAALSFKGRFFSSLARFTREELDDLAIEKRTYYT
jgi:hypothetical protein